MKTKSTIYVGNKKRKDEDSYVAKPVDLKDTFLRAKMNNQKETPAVFISHLSNNRNLMHFTKGLELKVQQVTKQY